MPVPKTTPVLTLSLTMIHPRNLADWVTYPVRLKWKSIVFLRFRCLFYRYTTQIKALPDPVKKELVKPSNEKLAAFISGGAGEDGVDGKKLNAKKDAKNPLTGDAASIFERTRTPLEKYNEQMAKLNKLLTAGAINQDTFARASLQAGEAMSGTSDKAGKLSESQQGQIDSLQTSLKIQQDQAANDAWSGKSAKVNGKTAAQRAQYLQNRIAVVSGKMPALDQNGNPVNFENLFPSNNPPLQDQSNPESIDKQAPQIINPLKIKEDETIKNFMNLNQRLSDIAAANPIIQPVQIQTKNDSSLLNIDLASLSAGTR